MEVRKCTQCNVTKDIDLFNKDMRLKSGYTKKCKLCTVDSQRKRVSERRKLIAEGKEVPELKNYQYFTCKRCDESKHRSEFHFDLLTDNRRTFCNSCKETNHIFPGFESWYGKNKNKVEVTSFLTNLRIVTGINGSEDLLKKYRS